MKPDYAALAAEFVEHIRANGCRDLYERPPLELLSDMQDDAQVEFVAVRHALKDARVWSDFQQQLKRHRYRPPPARDGRVTLILDLNLEPIVDALIDALGTHPNVYVQGHRLVRLVGDARRGAPHVAALTEATAAEVISAKVLLLQPGGEDGAPRPCPVDRLLVKAVLDRESYPGVRELRGVVSSPIIHNDGSFLGTPGYDPETKYYCVYDGPSFDVEEKPSKEAALAAAERVLAIVSDFPFEAPVHRAAWLALLLTLLLHPSIARSKPGFWIAARVAGTGKTLLADCASLIAFGNELRRTPYDDDDHQLDAAIMSALSEGASVLFHDNVDRPYGGAIIDQILTSQEISKRRYGTNYSTLKLRVGFVLVATGNNMVPRGDVARRVIVCQLASNEERPEQRSDFAIADLPGEILRRRGELLADLVTIVRAFIQAGRPAGGVAALGSFEEWSRTVRNLILWLGLEDPVATQAALHEDQDAPLKALLHAWADSFGVGEPATIREALDVVATAKRDGEATMREAFAAGPSAERQVLLKGLEARTSKARALEGALGALGLQHAENSSTAALGRKFKSFEGRVVDGLKFVSRRVDNTNAWAVVEVKPAAKAGA